MNGEKPFYLLLIVPRCKSQFFPDRYTYRSHGHCKQKLEHDTTSIRVSRRGVWMHRSIAQAQEHAVFCFWCGWSNFSGWLNDILQSKPAVSNQQAQHLFIEHMSRRLLELHGIAADFSTKANCTTHTLASTICDTIGHNGGRIVTLTFPCLQGVHS